MGKLSIGFCTGVIGLKVELHSQLGFCHWRKLLIDLASTCSMTAEKVQASSLPRKELLPFNNLYANSVNEGQVARLQQVMERLRREEVDAPLHDEWEEVYGYTVYMPYNRNNDTSSPTRLRTVFLPGYEVLSKRAVQYFLPVIQINKSACRLTKGPKRGQRLSALF